jgi:hypothetical protein
MKLKIYGTLLFLIFSALFLLTNTDKVYAAAISLTGKAKVLNTGNSYLNFTSFSSNVTVDNTNGNFAGYAFLEDMGWVAFGTTDNPLGPVNLNLTTGAVTGKAKVLNTGAYLDFTAYSSNVTVTLSTGVFSGYVFSEDAGWINFADTGVSSASFLPTAPSGFSGSTNSTTAITWVWTDNSSNETGFRVEDSSNTNKSGSLASGATSWQETSLSPNTSYTRHVHAFNTAGDSASSGNATAVTLSTLPTSSNISANRSTSTWYNTPSFIFTNGISGGFGGQVQYFRYAFDTSSTHTWTGSETQWTSGTLTQTAASDGNSWYLHLKGYNSADVENGTLDLGPFYYDHTAPPVPGDPSTTTPTGSTSQTWSWTAATDALSGVVNYAWRVTTSLGAAVTSGTTSSLSVVTTLAEGAYDFFVKAVDNATNQGSESSGSAVVDRTAPSIPGTPSTSSPTNNTTPAWNWSASTDSGSGLATPAYTLQWSKDAAFASGVYSSTSTTNSFTHTNNLTNGTWYMRIKATDTAGNSSSYSSNGSVIINTTAPNGSVSINSGNTYTNTTGVTLTISASDNVDPSSSLQMEISNNSDFSGASYESFMTSKAWTLPTTDGDKTVYVRIKDTSGNVGTYSDTITLDTTAPNSFDLDSPSDNTYTNNERPNFRWKAASTGDATSGLSRYKLEVDNGDTGDFTVDNIPVSRTIDYETTKYLVHYDGFSDTDSSNNYISVYTKHSVDWGASENDGKLKAGKRTWKVVAYDNAGNSRDASRTLYADYTNPSLSNTAILESDILGTKDGYTVVSNLRPTFTGDISDNYSPGKVEISFFKQNFFLGIETGRTLFLKESFDLKNTTDKTSLSFSLYPSQDIDYGKYRVDVTGIDKAGNSSATDSFNLWVLSGTQAKLILTQGKTKEETKKITEEVNNQAQVSLPELEKKAILRREKEASEFSKLTQGFGDSINVVANGVKQSFSQLAINFFSIFNDSISNVKNMAGSLIHTIASAFNAIGSGAKNIYLAISNTGKTISNNVDTAISNTGKVLIAWTGNAGNAYRRTAKSTPGIIGDAMLAVGNTTGNFLAFNYKLGSDFVKEQEKIQKQIGKTQKETSENLKTSAQNTQLFFGAISDGISGVNKELDKSQESVKKQIARTHQNSSDLIMRGGQALSSTYQSMVKPVDANGNFFYRVRVGVDTFIAIVFDPAPTSISGVIIEEVGKDYAVVSWKTNHFATGKVNYGQNLMYGKEVILTKREKVHTARLTGLKPGDRYFFEVMSQNKNYAYDAYYSFETKK